MSKKISQLTPSSSPTSGDIVPMASSAGSTIGVKLQAIKNLFQYDAGLNRSPIGISGNVNISGQLSTTGDLKISGSSYLGRNSSTTTLITGPIRASGDLLLSGHAIITGDFSATGNTIILGNNASSFVYISGRVISAGSSIFYGNHSVSGFCHISGPFALSGSGVFGVSGQSNIQHTFFGRTLFDQTGFFNSGISVKGAVTGNNLYVGDLAELRGTNYLYGNTTIGSSSANTLSVASTSTFSSPAIFTTNQEVQGNLNLWGNFINSGTSIFGNGNTDSATFHGNFTSRNYASFWSGIIVSGNVESSGQILARGSGIFATGVSINGPLTTSGRNYLGQRISDITHIQGTGYISGAADVRGYLGVSGNIHCAGTIYSNQVKQCMFDPQVKVGIVNGMYFDSGVGINKIRYLFYRNGNTTSRVLWNSGDFQSNDIVYCSGVLSNGTPYTDAQQNRLHSAYNGFFIVDSVFANSTDGGMILRPTGTVISPPAAAGNSSGAVPYILCHYRSGWLRNVSGVVPIQGSPDQEMGDSNPGNWVFHHKIIFPSTNLFSSSDYMVQLSCNQGSGQNSTEEHLTTRLKSVNVSYMDKNLNTEKTIYAGMNGTGDSLHNLNNYVASEYFAGMPTRVWARFEEF